MKNLNKLIAEIYGLVKFLEMSEEEQQRLIDQARAAARARRERQNARFARALEQATEIQEARISKLELDGMKVTKLMQHRHNGRICVMLQKEGVFDLETGRMRTKLAMVYHDGRYQEAFGKIAIQQDWV